MSFATPRSGKMSSSDSVVSGASYMSRSSSLSKMSSRRMEKLRDLHTRALLGDTLKKKLNARHKGRVPDDVLQEEIEKLTGQSKVDAASVQALQRRVDARALEYPTPRPATAMSAAGRSVLGGPATSDKGDDEEDLDNVLPVTEGKTWGAWAGATKPSVPEKPKLTPRTKAKEEWVLVMEHEAAMADEEDLAKTEKKKQHQKELTEFLAQQLAEKKARMKAEHEERFVWADRFEKEVQEAKQAEEAALAVRRAAAVREKVAREEQISFRDKRKALEAKAAARYERQLLDRLVQETKEVESAALVAKRAEKERLKQVFEDNKKHLAAKQKLLEKEQEEDKRRMEEYARVMEEQERQRQAYWAEFAEKQKKLAEAKVAYQAQDTGPRVLISDDDFARKEQERRQAEEEALQRRKDAKAAEDAACRAYIAEQLKRKEEERRREAEEARIAAARAREEAAIAELQETKRDQEARQRALAYKRDLVQQMSSRTAATNSASEAELLLNKKKFDAARAHLTRRS